MIADKACWERGCACYDSRLANSGVELQAKRTWVGLTDIDYAGLPLEQVGLVRWAESKLKEKNT